MLTKISGCSKIIKTDQTLKLQGDTSSFSSLEFRGNISCPKQGTIMNNMVVGTLALNGWAATFCTSNRAR